jgi:hypothetical protein
VGRILLAHPDSLLNRTAINLGMEVARNHVGGWGTRKPGGGLDHGGQLLPPRGVKELEEAEAEAGEGKEEEEEEVCG